MGKYVTKNNLIIAGLVLFIVILIFVIYNGFQTKTFMEYQLRQIGEAYQTAEYSDLICGFDADGDHYCEMDYWSEPASEVWFFDSVNGELLETNIPKSDLSFDAGHLMFSINGCPPKWMDVPRVNFDKFRRHQKYKYRVYMDKEYGTSLKKFKKFSLYRQEETPIEVDLWYFYVRNIRSADNY